jgi:hypothetical protein
MCPREGAEQHHKLMEITKVDLRGLEPGGQGWEDARAAATASMVAHGCVVIAYDALGPEDRQALFGRVMPEMFALPLEVKQRTAAPQDPFLGYIKNAPGHAIAWESLRVPDATEPGRVQDFVNKLWPDEGNPSFW